MKCDVLIVGAGLAGLVMAERISTVLGRYCVIVEKRDHIGGNCYDYYDEAGVLVHKYGPHIFYTNSEKILGYLAKFTQWIPYWHKAKSFVDGKLWSFPINLITFEQLLGRASTINEMERYLLKNRRSILLPRNAEEAIISQVGRELYEKFYRGYTMKQWNRDPKELDPSLCQHIPVRIQRNDLYFDATYQCIPKDGYTEMFYKMVDNSKVTLVLEEEFKKENWEYNHLIYTGILDEYFDYIYGPLPYRSVDFEHVLVYPGALKDGFYQEVAQINYPQQDVKFTRVTEMKQITGQKCDKSTIIREYPVAVYNRDPYYPVLTPSSMVTYARYKELADKCNNVSFVGRLAAFRNYNMSQTVGVALKEFEKLQLQ
jgi:UDP-galactopyranose mutase